MLITFQFAVFFHTADKVISRLSLTSQFISVYLSISEKPLEPKAIRVELWPNLYVFPSEQNSTLSRKHTFKQVIFRPTLRHVNMSKSDVVDVLLCANSRFVLHDWIFDEFVFWGDDVGQWRWLWFFVNELNGLPISQRRLEHNGCPWRWTWCDLFTVDKLAVVELVL